MVCFGGVFTCFMTLILFSSAGLAWMSSISLLDCSSPSRIAAVLCGRQCLRRASRCARPCAHCLRSLLARPRDHFLRQRRQHPCASGQRRPYTCPSGDSLQSSCCGHPLRLLSLLPLHSPRRQLDPKLRLLRLLPLPFRKLFTQYRTPRCCCSLLLLLRVCPAHTPIPQPLKLLLLLLPLVPSLVPRRPEPRVRPHELNQSKPRVPLRQPRRAHEPQSL